MRRRTLSLVALALLLPLVAPLTAHAQLLAVSGDGSVIATSGPNRVVYFHDPKSLEVTRRVRYNQPIRSLSLSSSGELVFVCDGQFEGILHVREVKTDKEIRTINELVSIPGSSGNQGSWFTGSIACDMLVVRQGKSLLVLSMKDAKDVCKIDMPAEMTQVVALSPDGKTLAVVTKSAPNDEDKNAAPPEGTKPGDDLFKLQHDGMGSVLYLHELPGGKQLARHPLWFSADVGSHAIAGFVGDDVVVMRYSPPNVRITPEGKVTTFRQPARLGYGMAISPDGKRLAAGSMLNSGFTFTLDPADAKPTPIKPAPDLPGFPEYYDDGMAFDLQGRLYGTTSGLRVFRLNDQSEIDTIQPIY